MKINKTWHCVLCTTLWQVRGAFWWCLDNMHNSSLLLEPNFLLLWDKLEFRKKKIFLTRHSGPVKSVVTDSAWSTLNLLWLSWDLLLSLTALRKADNIMSPKPLKNAKFAPCKFYFIFKCFEVVLKSSTCQSRSSTIKVATRWRSCLWIQSLSKTLYNNVVLKSKVGAQRRRKIACF